MGSDPVSENDTNQLDLYLLKKVDELELSMRSKAQRAMPALMTKFREFSLNLFKYEYIHS